MKKFQPLLYNTDYKTAKAPLPKNGKDYTLEELYAILGCDTVQLVPAKHSVYICDEDGKLKGLPINIFATQRARLLGIIDKYDHFVGKVLVCPKSMIQ